MTFNGFYAPSCVFGYIVNCSLFHTVNDIVPHILCYLLGSINQFTLALKSDFQSTNQTYKVADYLLKGIVMFFVTKVFIDIFCMEAVIGKTFLRLGTVSFNRE